MFEIKTDKEFFEKFKDTELKLKKLSAYFQNPDTEMTAIEAGEYNLLSNSLKREFNALLKEASSRIQIKK